MESAKEKKEHWMLIDLTKFLNSLDLTSLDSENLQLLKELISQYNDQIELEKEYVFRFERNLKTQKKIMLTFFIFFIMFQLNMMYNSFDPLSLDKLIFLSIFVALTVFVWSRKLG